jgi:predicted DNA-binding transcriptional regulator YafY
VSRVQSVRLTTEPAERPDDFDLAEAWRSIVTSVDAQRAPVRVRLWADARAADVLGWMFGGRVDVGAFGADGRRDVELRAQSEEMVARQLAGFADRIDVVAPVTVRNYLADIGRDLLRANT